MARQKREDKMRRQKRAGEARRLRHVRRMAKGSASGVGQPQDTAAGTPVSAIASAPDGSPEIAGADAGDMPSATAPRPASEAQVLAPSLLAGKWGRRILRALMVLSVFFGVAQIALYMGVQSHWEIDSILVAVAYTCLITAVATCMVLLVLQDRHGNVHAARMIARLLVVLIVFACAFDVLFVDDTPLASVFVFQFVCVIAYQMANDPNLDRHNPREGGFRGAIPLSFFNLFWIFVICSVVGLFGETVVSLIRDGHWESRAGFVFGPFSPIYGVGAVLITAALNSLHRRNPVTLFLVAGVTGAAFEYFAGWFFETAFGIVAWSYEGQPLNFHGHTSAIMACVWGFIGLAWMKLALPYVMQFIDLIPLRVRVGVTLGATIILLTDAILTVICLDCWYLRKLGAPVETPWQEFCARYFDDAFMQRRFETMSMWPVLADR